MQYASETTVPVEKTRAEIERVVSQYGAKSFASGWQGNRAMIGFEMRDRQIRFILPLPDKASKEFTHGKIGRCSYVRPLPVNRVQEKWEQACRQKWRALLLAIKAKLEAVESKISSFDSEFMAHIVLPDGCTIGERILPKLAEVLAGKEMPRLLPGPVQ